MMTGRGVRKGGGETEDWLGVLACRVAGTWQSTVYLKPAYSAVLSSRVFLGHLGGRGLSIERS